MSEIFDDADAPTLECEPQEEHTATPSDVRLARRLTKRIRISTLSERESIFALYSGKRYRHLGYRSWEHYGKSEFGWSRRTSFRKLTIALVYNALKGANFGTYLPPDSWLEKVGELPPETWQTAWEQVKEIASKREFRGRSARFHKAGLITFAIVRQVVELLKPIPEAVLEPEADAENEEVEEVADIQIAGTVRYENVHTDTKGDLLFVQIEPGKPRRLMRICSKLLKNCDFSLHSTKEKSERFDAEREEAA